MLRLIVFLMLLVGSSGARSAATAEVPEEHYRWYAQVGTYAHWRDDEAFTGVPWFAGIEYHPDQRWFGGFSMFNNSFGQFSQYLYLGVQFNPWDSYPAIRIKLSAGVAQGYKDEHYDTLPIRWGGSWGLGFVPAIGYQKGRVGVDVAVLGVGGLLFLVGVGF
ncbi:MAG: hypothetical protein MUC55_06135 [Burkholderiales bacterium]|jgi:hypothetical protein|nr:hypothetical protein [Burkholderiales bacterium]